LHVIAPSGGEEIGIASCSRETALLGGENLNCIL